MAKFCPMSPTIIGTSCVPANCAPACELAGEGNVPICPITAAVSSLATMTAMLDMLLPAVAGKQPTSAETQNTLNPLEVTLKKLGVSETDQE